MDDLPENHSLSMTSVAQNRFNTTKSPLLIEQ